jgi:glucose 1-dehydrogenase/3-oxoacyl-[acyl-carrier protein] reductase
VAINYITGPEPVQGKDNRADADALVEEIRGAGGRAFAVEADVSKGDQVRQMVAQIADELGTIDVLINNAGIETIIPFLEMSEAQYQQVLDVNLKGEWLCAQAVVRQLVAKQQAGAIVNIASIQSGMALPGRSHYAPSKRGVELAPQNIRVNCINPGLIATDMTDWVMKDPQILPVVLNNIPLKRAGEPDEIAKVAVFLASEDASYVTGQCIYVDGGWVVT